MAATRKKKQPKPKQQKPVPKKQKPAPTAKSLVKRRKRGLDPAGTAGAKRRDAEDPPSHYVPGSGWTDQMEADYTQQRLEVARDKLAAARNEVSALEALVRTLERGLLAGETAPDTQADGVPPTVRSAR